MGKSTKKDRIPKGKKNRYDSMMTHFLEDFSGVAGIGWDLLNVRAQ
jgi:hypothetical protein